MGKGVKLHGGPLRAAYQLLSQIPEAPAQPEVLRKLQRLLEKKGFSYHPRTIKRQLQGDIEYIPQTLETAFFDWVRESFPKIYSRVEAAYQQEKNQLVQSQDQDLYVSPSFFLDMADAYLLLHKDLSRRRLALALKDSLGKNGFSLGLETLQAALSGKTQKVRKIVEDQLLEYFLQENLKNRQEVEAFLGSHRGTDIAEVQKVEVGPVTDAVEAFLLKAEGFTKRQLALHLKDRLAQKGYEYHLSSIQSILEGNTRKTRKVVLDTLKEVFDSQGVGPSPVLPPEQLHWNHYVDASSLPEKVRLLTERHSRLTRRQIAGLLKEDLEKRNFFFSLNTLQFILSGKTKRVKKVILELFDTYLADTEGNRIQALQTSHALSRKGRNSPDRRVLEAFERLRQTVGPQREDFRKEFLAAREELIRHRWAKRRQPTRVYRKYAQNENWDSTMENASEENFSSDYPSPEAEVSFSTDVPFKRLVS